MNIPPFLEKLLLSNEATWKSATLGLNSMNCLKIPEGKTAVILGYELNPFCNAYLGELIAPIWEEGYTEQITYQEFFTILVQRLLFQVQILNDKYFTAFTHFPEFTTTGLRKHNGTPVYPLIELNFKRQGSECFIYIDRSIYFQFVFQIQNDFIPYYATFLNSFTPVTQSVPTQPISFYGSSTNQNFYSYTVTPGIFNSQGNASEQYNPLLKSQGNQADYTGYLLSDGEQEFLRFGTNNSGTGLLSPYPAMPNYGNTPDPITPGMNFNMPTINIQYVLINKRSSDTGIYSK